MVTIRIQELTEDKGLTLHELCQIAGISEERMQKYVNGSIEMAEETASDLRKIAAKLDEPLVKLIKPVARKAAFRLNIFEIAEEKSLTLEELSKKSGVHPAFLVFYGTQPICKNKLLEPLHQTHLTKISKVLEYSPEDLKITAELPSTMFRVKEMAEENGLTLEDLSLLTNLPIELISLISTQPVEIDDIKNVRLPKKIQNPFCTLCCLLKAPCCSKCSKN